ncbi:MAG: ABC transporter permease [Candidatus Woesearchaeota archaeon]
MIREYFAYALKSLRRRKLRSWLTMIGIFIGIAAVVSLIGLGQGLQYAISSQFGQLGTDKLTITASGGFGPPGTGVVKPLTTQNLERVRQISGVERAAARLVDSAKIGYNERIEIGYIASMPDGEDRRLVEETVNLKVSQGRLLKDGDSGVVVVGSNFGRQDNAFGKPIEVGSKIFVNGRKMTVIGILKKQGSFILDGIVLINEREYREIANRAPNDVDVIAVQVSTGANIEEVEKDIERLMRRERKVKEGEEDFSVRTPQAALEQINSTLFAVNLFVYIIAGISIVVGGIGIMNTMYTAVLERRREIGIMKAIGAKNSNIFNIFFIESGLIGMTGGIIGASIGVGLSYGLAAAGRRVLESNLIAAQINPWLVVGAILGSFILGSVFGALPAVKATKLHPVEALKYAK